MVRVAHYFHWRSRLGLSLLLAAALGATVTARAGAQSTGAGITATFAPATGVLKVTGDDASNIITLSRDTAGTILVNGGAVAITGGTPTVANTVLIEVRGQGGNDEITLDQSNGALPPSKQFGGDGDDTLSGGVGTDELRGGNGNDTLAGRFGSDLQFGDGGNDRFLWNPGDGNDINEGGSGRDTVEVSGGNVAEAIDISANGGRVRFFRNVASVTLDIGTVETVAFNAAGGADTITVNDLRGTALTRVAVNLAGGDATTDTIIVNGTAGNDRFVFGGSAVDGATVSGLGATIAVSGAEIAHDRITVNALDGDDAFDGSNLFGGVVGVTADGGAGIDTVTVNGTSGADTFAVTANGALVRVDRLSPSPFAFDIGSSEELVLKGNGGDDSFSAVGNLAALIHITMDGGPGNDTILGSNGADLLLGGTGNDFIDGQQGIDAAHLGDGNDTFQWDPGDGSDTVEGDGGTDTLLFNGSNGAETFDLSANGARARLFRNLASITQDLGSVEVVTINAFGSADVVNVNDLAGSGVSRVNVNLAAFGGSGGDGQPDSVVVYGTSGDDALSAKSSGTGGVTVTGMAAQVTVTGGENASDRLIVNGLGGTDAFDGSNTPGGLTSVVFEGGEGTDTVTVNGTSAADTIAVTANGALVRVDRLTGSPISFDTSTVEELVLKGNGGNDSISAVGNLAALIHITMDGGPGNDTILGSNGTDLLLGGSGNDFVDGQQGIDVAHLGDGADTFQWDPGDGSDTVEGDGGTDTLLFNGSNIGETFDISANGARARLTRNIASIIQDLGGVEAITLNTFGGADIVNVNDMTGSGVTRVTVNLTLFGGGADAQPDSISVVGTAGDDTITVNDSGSEIVVSGLSARVTITGSEAAHDRLTVAAMDGTDTVNASGLPAGLIGFVADGGAGDDTLTGSAGDDLLAGGDGDDTLKGGPGDDVLEGGTGNNVIIQD